MKKLISLVVALALVCSLACVALAASTTVECDHDHIEAGDTVTVTVSLDETIGKDNGQTCIQLYLYYNADAVTYTSANLGEGWLDYGDAEETDDGIVNSEKYSRVMLNYFQPKSKTIELPAGTIMTVVFTAKETLEVSAVEASFDLSLICQDAYGNTVVSEENKLTVSVCAGHEWTETSNTATCTEDGVITYTCSKCGGTKEEAVEATGHEARYWPNTYSDDDWAYSFVEEEVCRNCGAVMSSNTYYYLFAEKMPLTSVEVAPGETITFYPYCLVGGEVTVSGGSFTLGIQTFDWFGDPDELTEYPSENGQLVFSAPEDSYSKVYYYLTNTGDTAATYTFSVEFPVGHSANPEKVSSTTTSVVEFEAENYTGYFWDVIATCDGTVTISVTGDYWAIYAIPVDAEGNYDYDLWFYSNYESGDSAVYEVSAGYRIEVYAYCRDADWNYPAGTVTVNFDVEYAHEYTTETVAPTCEEQGYDIHTCTKCGESYKDNYVDALGHDATSVHTDPTCTEAGYDTYTCATCGKVWTEECEAALGHTYEEGVCTVCGEADPDYNVATGDSVGVLVALAVVSAMSVVALPIVKKHF